MCDISRFHPLPLGTGSTTRQGETLSRVEPWPDPKMGVFMIVGKLAASCGFNLPLQVMQSAAGFYLGTSEFGMPFSRESEQYWPSQEEAEDALEKGTWTQKEVA